MNDPFDEDPPLAAAEPSAAEPAAAVSGSASALSVAELTRRISFILRGDEVLADTWVRGEIAEFRSAASGHCYFTLKDDRASLSCVMWKGVASRLPFAVAAGMQVIAHGGVSVFEQRGQYQLSVDALEPDGIGALHLALEQAKARLQAEGLLDPARKRPLPSFPRRVAVITSLAGAAVRDVCVILTRDPSPPDVVLIGAQVQGVGAEESLIRALDLANRGSGADVIILGRGGGSMEDLWCFNSEALARAIAASELPVISAVGHETDFTLSDMVADLRAPTPTAAAEIVAAARNDYVTRLRHARVRTRSLVSGALDAARRRHLSSASRPVIARPGAVVAVHAERVARLRERVASLVGRRVELGRARLDGLRARPALTRPETLVRQREQRLDDLTARLSRTQAVGLRHWRHRLALAAGKLDGLSPLATLARGYASVRKLPGGEPVTRIAAVQTGEHVRVRLTDGQFEAWVLETENDDGARQGSKQRRGRRGA